jgi:hypothetical protein
MILSLNFRIILTNVTFVTTSVASLILDSSCFVFGFPFSASTLGHVSLKCCLKYLLHYLVVLKFSAETESFGLSNWTLRFWQICFVVSSFGHATILWPFSLQAKHLL